VVEGDPVPLPDGVVLYYYGYVFTEGIPADRWLRAHQTQDGLVIRDLSEALPEGSGGLSAERGFASGQFATIICVQGYCGGMADPSPDAKEERYVSSDGGITWQFHPGLHLPEGVYIAGTRSDGQQIAFRVHDPPEPFEWFTWPEMQAVTPPVPDAHARMLDGRLVWMTVSGRSPGDGGTIYDEDGNVIAAPVKLPLSGSYDVVRGAVPDLVWWIPFPRDNDATVYLSQVDPGGAVLRTVKLKGLDPAPVGWVDDDRVVIRRWAWHDGSLADTAIVNLQTGEMNRIDGLQPTDKDRDVYSIGVVVGAFAMVDTGGDCLNVRKEPGTSAEGLDCFADGVLLEVTGGAVADEAGREWLPVRAPGGIEGYASSEFLRR
jgi:hypothetical protein